MKHLKLYENFDSAELSPEAKGYIKAYTSKGGQDYSNFEEFDNQNNKDKFIEEINKLPRNKNVDLFRMVWVSEEKWEELFESGYVENGNIIEFGKIQSSTKDRARSGVFGNPDIPNPQSVRFNIKTNGKYTVDISKYSHYPEEEESILLPEAKFKVTDWDYQRGVSEIYMEEV